METTTRGCPEDPVHTLLTDAWVCTCQTEGQWALLDTEDSIGLSKA